MTSQQHHPAVDRGCGGNTQMASVQKVGPQHGNMLKPCTKSYLKKQSVQEFATPTSTGNPQGTKI